LVLLVAVRGLPKSPIIRTQAGNKPQPKLNPNRNKPQPKQLALDAGNEGPAREAAALSAFELLNALLARDADVAAALNAATGAPRYHPLDRLLAEPQVGGGGAGGCVEMDWVDGVRGCVIL
jgi:hypothetical protein